MTITQRYRKVQRAQIDERDHHGDRSQHHERFEDRVIRRLWRDVARHVLTQLTVFLRPVHQVQEREQGNPHDIDEVPLQARQLHWREPLPRKPSPVRHPRDHRAEARADHYVQRVKPGQSEVQGKERSASAVRAVLRKRSLVPGCDLVPARRA